MTCKQAGVRRTGVYFPGSAFHGGVKPTSQLLVDLDVDREWNGWTTTHDR